MKRHSRDNGQPSAETPPGWIWPGLFVLLLLLWGIDFFFGGHHEGVHWQSQPLFFVWYGFLSCLVLVGLAKVAAIFLDRRDDYYD